MRRTKKLTSMLLVLILILTTFTACKKEETTAEEPQKEKEFKFREISTEIAEYKTYTKQLEEFVENLEKEQSGENEEEKTFSLSSKYEVSSKNNSLYLKNLSTNKKDVLMKGNTSSGKSWTAFRFQHKIDDTKFVYSKRGFGGSMHSGIYDIEKKVDIPLESYKNGKRIAGDEFLAGNENTLYFEYRNLAYGNPDDLMITKVDISFLKTEKYPKTLNEHATTILTDISKKQIELFTQTEVTADGKYYICLYQDTYDHGEDEKPVTPTIYIYSLETQEVVHTYELKEFPKDEEGNIYTTYSIGFVNENELYVFNNDYNEEESSATGQYLYYIVKYE